MIGEQRNSWSKMNKKAVLSLVSQGDCKMPLQIYLDTSKVVDFGTNQKRVYDFLLVSNSILGPILHRFGDIAGVFLLLSDRTPISPQFWGCSRCTRSPMLGSAWAEALCYSAMKLFSKNSNLTVTVTSR